MYTICNQFIFLFVVQFVNCGVLPVDKCNLEDSSCLKTSFQKAVPIFMSGIPDLGVEVLDIMNLYDYSFEIQDLKFNLKQGTYEGMKTTIVDNVTWSPKKKLLEISSHHDATVKGKYKAGGKVLILPITGDGDIEIKMTNKYVEDVMAAIWYYYLTNQLQFTYENECQLSETIIIVRFYVVNFG